MDSLRTGATPHPPPPPPAPLRRAPLQQQYMQSLNDSKLKSFAFEL